VTSILDSENIEQEGFAIVYFGDSGFELFASNINDQRLEIMLTNYPTLMGMMQNQKIEGLATTRINKNLFLFAFAINVKNLDARDIRLKRKTISIINFVVSRETYKELMLNFDDFENFLEDYFKPISFIFDLYAIDYSKIIPMFLERQRLIEKSKRKKEEKVEEASIAIEFNRWLAQVDFDEVKKKK
jgi:hypothetical protein